ncbi:MAG: GDSL family lipase [Ruminococcaceae bacterium]|nr:GDSL family lipase [Oscillospiraceae bacterium]
MIRILFQGDSITDGGRLKPVESRWDRNHQIGHSYVYPIVGELGRRHPGKYVFINRGLSGDKVSTIGDRWQTDTLDEHPDVLSILLGINGNGNMDGQYPEGAEEHLRVFDAQYRALLDTARAQNPDLKLILIEPFALPVGKLQEHYDDFLAVFSHKQAIIRRIAEDYGAIFIPVQKRLEQLVRETAPILTANGCDTDPCAYWMWDGIHPTEPLHHYLAELWLEAAKDIL